MEIHLPSEAAALIRKTLSRDAEYARAVLMKGYEVLTVVDPITLFACSRLL